MYNDEEYGNTPEQKRKNLRNNLIYFTMEALCAGSLIFILVIGSDPDDDRIDFGKDFDESLKHWLWIQSFLYAIYVLKRLI
jgi:hypothetical protein